LETTQNEETIMLNNIKMNKRKNEIEKGKQRKNKEHY